MRPQSSPDAPETKIIKQAFSGTLTTDSISNLLG